MSPEQCRRRHPGRRIFVVGDVEDDEKVRVGVVGGERRDVATWPAAGLMDTQLS